MTASMTGFERTLETDMPTDNERREVAQRLREIRPCKSGHIKWWEIARALGLKQPAGWFGWEKFEPDSVNRLADLIEPDESGQNQDTVQKESPAVQKAPEFDRDALMALADEIEDNDVTYCVSTQYVLDSYARRIREALGVSGDE